MAFKRNKVIQILKSFIKKLDESVPISRAYLFGSYAKGHPGRWSDIDLAVVSPKFKGVRFNDFKMLLPYLRDCPNYLEVHPFKKEDFNPHNLFVKEIIEKGIRIKP